MDLTDSDLDDLLREVDPLRRDRFTPSASHAIDDAVFQAVSQASNQRATTRHLLRPKRLVLTLATTGVLAAGGIAAAATIGSQTSTSAPDFGETSRAAAEGIALPPGDSIDNYILAWQHGPAGDIGRDNLRVAYSYDAVCAWQGYWLQAHDAGDVNAAKRALTVLESVPDWPQWNGNVDSSVTDAYRAEASEAAADNPAPTRQSWAATCTELPRAWALK